MKRSAIVIMLCLLALTGIVAGCSGTGDVPAPTVTSTPEATVPPTMTPSPTPGVVSRTWNINRELSGLSITLTVVAWAGDDMTAEWVIENPTAKAFEGSRLYAIFTPGALATDQSGKEGEYFIPEPILRDLGVGDIKHYETTWRFYPESSKITIRLHDIFIDGNDYVDTNTQFVFSR